MREIKVIKLCDYPAFSERAALWFSQKWGISVDDYRDSMELSMRQKNDIPQWYIVLEEGERIIAGAGVIDNDFHDRKDLSQTSAHYLWRKQDANKILQSIFWIL